MTLSYFFLSVLVLLFCGGALSPLAASASDVGSMTFQNGVISVEVNGIAPPGQRYPCITSLSVEGLVIVPPIAVGALFQMDIRSAEGDNYNPTQSGACAGAASVLDAYLSPWGMIGSNHNGILMGVTPRTFESSTGGCTNGIAAPYYFNFGIQLGDDVSFPKEAMIVEQQFWKTSADAPDIVSVGIEVPTVYYDCRFALYAFYLPINDPTHWEPLRHPSTGENYLPDWPVGDGFMVNGWGNMRCNGNTTTALCAATYSGAILSTAGGTNNGAGGCPANLVPSADYTISDSNPHTRLAIFAVGTQGTVSAAMEQTAAKVSNAWGDL